MKAPVCAILLCLLAALPVQGGIIVDHEPNLPYGLSSDTENAPSGWWQQVADDVIVDKPAAVDHITWWGSYLGNIVPTNETMRIRLYGARTEDGLPGQVLFEKSILNPQRLATGGIIVNTEPGTYSEVAEYRFEVNLTQPAFFQANVPYWLEIVQLGDSSTRFYWNHSSGAGDVLARCRSGLPYWVSGSLRDMAFQLSASPEPAVLALLLPFALSFRRLIRPRR